MTLLSFWPAETADRAPRDHREQSRRPRCRKKGGRRRRWSGISARSPSTPDYAPALNNLGTALRAAGRVDEAVKVYGQALARDADTASVHYNLGNALMAQGKPAEAAAEFQLALAANPRFVDALNNLGHGARGTGAAG